jgi:hypothetical protein
LACLALGALGWVAGPRLPGVAIADSIAERMICAVRLSHGCRADPELLGPYGAEVAEQVRGQAPRISYERGMSALPVDFRACRMPVCGDGEPSGRVSRSLGGRPAAAFTHVIDCRDPAPAPYVCTGERAGRLYIQYWFYYANSATLRGVPVAAGRGVHLDDWESYQVRIDPDGKVWARASSHHGYNGASGIGSWPSDLGWRAGTSVSDALGAHDRSGWTRSEGTLYVSGGSHAGHVTEASLRRELTRSLSVATLATAPRPTRGTFAARDRRYEAARSARSWEQALFGDGPRYTPRGSLRLVPIETLTTGDSASFAITPPWRKRVYFDPEYTGTD